MIFKEKVNRLFFFVLITSTCCLLPIYISASTQVSYQYDAQNRIINAAFDNGNAIDYTYDSANNRVNTTITVPVANSHIYEDAEDATINGWDVYDNTPAQASIVNCIDTDKSSRVIEFTGSGTANGYRLRNNDGSYWNDTYKIMQWSMRYSENFVVYIAAETTDGFRYIYYTSAQTDTLGDGVYIHHGLDSQVKDGNWHTITRDLEYDLKEAQPDNELIAVLGFLIRGTGRVDDIQTLESLSEFLDSDGDGISDLDEMNIYGTHPYHSDTDNDGLSDGEELNFWGSGWNSDPDGDGLINILDPDADNNGISDGIEFHQGTDPNDPDSVPDKIIYEDGEDGLITGWDVYDNTPTGATITNVYDDIRLSNVIEFTGSGTANGYRLRNDNGAWWDYTSFKIMQWSMRYSENFVVYIAAETTDGFRYIYYTSTQTDTLGDGVYIHHGLGSQVKDGNWHTITRDLEYDLKEAQPDNELIAVLGFLIRGTGRVDDIQTLLNP